ncbi:DNA-binding protein [Pseudomonas sp. FFUP_PS_473]|uniref:bifunctional MaoC family dehydratase N-terminal/OB-fold nucleic acid binding domain-containing protein n=1 Tax=Pseudomonas sp. FFUP_PS_473 TaxID=2060418 RepID=UPI000C7DB403|nr:OB-fold domain-containing protein [Pseudomonas sp. FFUP_PS_473]PLP88067.1 DNA-binding protein [Pseudomonas sp. FFUP_PS_473]
MADPQLLSNVRALVGRQYGRVYAWDEVNAPMIRQWCEIMGVENPLYTDPAFALGTPHEGLIAPPAMLQVWTMEGFHANHYPPGSTDENPYEVLKLFEQYGYNSVVAVNSELSFTRPLRLGEKLYYTTRLDAVGDEKTTALGTGFFVTLVMSHFVEKAGGDEPVGELLFRVFKFRPANAQPATPAPAVAAAPAKAKRPQPGISDDTRFFWEGCAQGQLLIQRCTACATLRHPPAPVCIQCHSFDWDTVQASGRASLYSFVVMHYPEVAPFDHPNPIGLIELEEGVRLIAGLVGIEREQLQIGQRLQVEFQTFDDALTLPLFRPVGA